MVASRETYPHSQDRCLLSKLRPLYISEPCQFSTAPSPVMPSRQQRDRYRSMRPHVQVRIQGEAEPIVIVPPTPATVSSTNISEVGDAAQAKTVFPDVFPGEKQTTESFPARSTRRWRPENLPPALRWIPANWTWSKWKPVVRSALAAWISLLFFLIPTTLHAMGQVSFSLLFCFGYI